MGDDVAAPFALLEELRYTRNDYAHLDERLDSGGWIETADDFLAWQHTNESGTRTVDLRTLLLATDALYRAAHGDLPDLFPVPWAAEWLGA